MPNVLLEAVYWARQLDWLALYDVVCQWLPSPLPDVSCRSSPVYLVGFPVQVQMDGLPVWPAVSYQDMLFNLHTTVIMLYG